jgi:hypothetical protein
MQAHDKHTRFSSIIPAPAGWFIRELLSNGTGRLQRVLAFGTLAGTDVYTVPLVADTRKDKFDEIFAVLSNGAGELVHESAFNEAMRAAVDAGRSTYDARTQR